MLYNIKKLLRGNFGMCYFVGRNKQFKNREFKNKKMEARKKVNFAKKKIASIRKEIAILVSEQNMNIQDARRQMNEKYGVGWRERGLISNSDDQWEN